MKPQIILLFVLLCGEFNSFAQSITLEPQTSTKRFSISSTGDYGYFSTNYVGNANLLFKRDEPAGGTGNAGTTIGNIYTTNLNHFILGTPLANTTGSLMFTTQNSPRLAILPNGNVGIGTFNPLQKLHVSNGSSGVSFVANSNAIFEDNTSNYITVATPEANESGILFSKATTGDASGGIIYKTNNDLSFRTNGNVERMVLTNAGKLGLGVTSPTKTVEIQSASTNTELQLTSTGSNSSILTLNATSTGSASINLTKNTDIWTFRSSGSTLTLDYNGNIAFGSIPALDIIVSAEPSSSFKYYTVKPSYQNYVQLGTSSNRFREIWSTNALNTSSDRRLKTNISEVKYGLDEVLKLKPVDYQWKKAIDNKKHLGFIAQEVEKIIPEIVSKSNLSDEEFEKLEKKGELPSDTYGMEYTGLIPILVKAIQEQQQIINEKSAKIAQLEEKMKNLEQIEARLTLLEQNQNKNKKVIIQSDK